MIARSRSGFLVGSAATLAAAPALVRAQNFPPIRVAGVATDDFTPVYWAAKSGMYAKAGLDVQIVPTASGSIATTAVVAGTYEIAKTSPIAAILAYAKGLPLVAIGSGGMWDPKNPFNLTVVAADAPLKTAADLAGKTAGSPALNDLNGFSIDAWVDKNGGDSKTLKWVELPVSATVLALRERRIDVANLVEPQLSAAVASGAVRIFAPAFSAIAERFALTSFVVNPNWAAKNGEAIRRWLRVTYEAGAFTNAHHAETIPMMSEVTKIAPDVFRTMVRVEATTAATADPGGIQPLIDVAARYHAIPKAFPAREMYAAV